MTRSSRYLEVGKFLRCVTLVAVGALALAGCAPDKSSKPVTKLSPDALAGTSSLRVEYPRTVAIRPFVNSTASPEAGETVRRLFYNFFSSLNYVDLEIKVVDRALKNGDLTEKVQSGDASYKEVCRAIGAELFKGG